MTPATEKAVPIPAEVRKVAQGFCKKHAWHRSYVDALAADLWSAILADRVSQEERIREDEREAGLREAESIARSFDNGRYYHSGEPVKHGEEIARLIGNARRARLRGDAS